MLTLTFLLTTGIASTVPTVSFISLGKVLVSAAGEIKIWQFG